MNKVFTPSIINEKTQLGWVVSLLEGFGRYFYAEDEKSIFDLRNWTLNYFITFFCVKAV